MMKMVEQYQAQSSNITEHLKPVLKIGDPVGSKDVRYGCVGPFVRLQDKGDICFLTNFYTFGQPDIKDRMKIVYYHSTEDQNQYICGEVIMIGKNLEVALVKISDDFIPKHCRFIDVDSDDLSRAGLKLPYKMRGTCDLSKLDPDTYIDSKIVVHCTNGRLLTGNIKLIPLPYEPIKHHLIFDTDSPECLYCSSGSAVFLVEDNSLSCIGILKGDTRFPGKPGEIICLFILIQAILDTMSSELGQSVVIETFENKKLSIDRETLSEDLKDSNDIFGVPDSPEFQVPCLGISEQTKNSVFGLDDEIKSKTFQEDSTFDSSDKHLLEEELRSKYDGKSPNEKYEKATAETRMREPKRKRRRVEHFKIELRSKDDGKSPNKKIKKDSSETRIPRKAHTQQRAAHFAMDAAQSSVQGAGTFEQSNTSLLSSGKKATTTFHSDAAESPVQGAGTLEQLNASLFTPGKNEKISENTGTTCNEATEIGKLLNQDDLDILCKSRDRKDKQVVQRCETICNMIKSSSEYIIHVYAAYKKGNERKIFFVVTVMWDFDLNENDIGYRMIKRNYGDLSTEGIDISSSIEERGQIMSDDENRKLSASISKYAEKLMDNHRYLNVISGSYVRSKNYKPSAMCLSKQSCMALYVLVKGYIPIEEDAFQNTYDGVAVDIREGLFFPYGTAREYHDDIKMGCKITRYTGIAGDYGGTLGGFIDHPSYGVCGITCAHALMFPDELKKCVENNGEISWPNIFSSDIVCQPNPVPDNRNNIGRIVQAIYKEGDQSEAGVDVAIIQIEERPPKSGHFPEIGPKGTNIPYTFETGKTCGVSRALEKVLFKFGCISDFTQGRFKSTPVCVRPFDFNHIGFTIRLLNQLGIEGDKFATHGDSGSLVFCKGMSEDFECIGMVEGGVSDNTCVVTPIQSILAALKVSCLKEFESIKTKNELKAVATKVNSNYSMLQSIMQHFKILPDQMQKK